MKLSVLCAGRCGAMQGGGSGPGLNFVFTLETGTWLALEPGAWSSDRSCPGPGSPAAPPPGETARSRGVRRCGCAGAGVGVSRNNQQAVITAAADEGTTLLAAGLATC